MNREHDRGYPLSSHDISCRDIGSKVLPACRKVFPCHHVQHRHPDSFYDDSSGNCHCSRDSVLNPRVQRPGIFSLQQYQTHDGIHYRCTEKTLHGVISMDETCPAPVCNQPLSWLTRQIFQYQPQKWLKQTDRTNRKGHTKFLSSALFFYKFLILMISSFGMSDLQVQRAITL